MTPRPIDYNLKPILIFWEPRIAWSARQMIKIDLCSFHRGGLPREQMSTIEFSFTLPRFIGRNPEGFTSPLCATKIIPLPSLVWLVWPFGLSPGVPSKLTVSSMSLLYRAYSYFEDIFQEDPRCKYVPESMKDLRLRCAQRRLFLCRPSSGWCDPLVYHQVFLVN